VEIEEGARNRAGNLIIPRQVKGDISFP
jgi:hypothetical protein